ncbi:cytochrome c oxidase assembly factor 3, mitochondrial-like isoform X2 [Ptiloglossa arizonensis]
MPKVKLEELRPFEVLLLKQAEELNFQRAIKHKKNRKSNALFGISLAVGVLGIYFYTINAVKQETFLDDFQKPETIIETKTDKV